MTVIGLCASALPPARARYFRMRKYALAPSRFALEIRMHSRCVSCLLSKLVTM